ncbi:hypothetical protein Taro_016713 [Colocasia esculenta]|uniref:Uncharacterized protein n=1 Tax=Colocasia esculenta TaxID=4460 RepID=A0A843UX48_COLES|nr:hypothetical protein [Colocasia esculenta]
MWVTGRRTPNATEGLSPNSMRPKMGISLVHVLTSFGTKATAFSWSFLSRRHLLADTRYLPWVKGPYRRKERLGLQLFIH